MGAGNLNSANNCINKSAPRAGRLMRLRSLPALQVSFSFSNEQHEVHSLRSLADARLVGRALAGKCGQSGPFQCFDCAHPIAEESTTGAILATCAACATLNLLCSKGGGAAAGDIV